MAKTKELSAAILEKKLTVLVGFAKFADFDSIRNYLIGLEQVEREELNEAIDLLESILTK